MKKNYKHGELEAKKILEKLMGIEFEDDYCDDNSQKSMPDLKMKNGRYLEVTHTYHNNRMWNKANKFHDKNTSLEERLNSSVVAENSWSRWIRDDYETDDDPNREFDKKIIKQYFGFDVDTHEHTENCDCPTMKFSSENIWREILDDKGKKYTNGDTDLFIFVTAEELNSFINENKIEKSAETSFEYIYLCTWNIEKSEYDTAPQELYVIDVKNTLLNMIKKSE